MTAFERGVLIGFRMARGRTLTTEYLRNQFDISQAQAKRDLLMVETALGADVMMGPRNQVILAVHPARNV